MDRFFMCKGAYGSQPLHGMRPAQRAGEDESSLPGYNFYHIKRKENKMKKLKMFRLKKKIYRGFGKVLAAVLLLGMTGPCISRVSAAEENQTISWIYHQHTGSSEEEGGCYRSPVYHSHSGSETDGGGCYQTPVYHVHTGDEVSGGSCYGTAVLHEHSGDDVSGGGCFVPVTHSHVEGCYRKVGHEEYGCYIVSWHDTLDGDYEGNDFKIYNMSCGRVIHGTNPGHQHEIVSCGKENVIEGYILGCNKTEESIEKYLFDCEKTEGESIDSYGLSCEKTTSDIDSYALSCGKNKETPIGKITITENKGERKEESYIAVNFEDLSEGELKLTENPFTWYGPAGSVIGTGDTIRVSENGTYSVVIGVENEDVDKNSLRSQIGVSSIEKKNQNNSGGKEDGDHGKDEDHGHGNGGDKNSDNPVNDQDKAASPAATPAPTAAPVPAATPAPVIAESASKNNKGNGESVKNTARNNRADEMPKKTPSPAPVLAKKTESVKLPEKKSQPETAGIEVKEQKKNIFGSPAVQVITITAGTLVTLGGLFLLLYFFRMSVRVYNDDGSGKMIYLGRCRVKLTDEGYRIEISDAMEEKAITNRYCIKPGLFRLLRGEDTELLVCRMQKRISVYLNKEMIVVI